MKHSVNRVYIFNTEYKCETGVDSHSYIMLRAMSGALTFRGTWKSKQMILQYGLPLGGLTAYCLGDLWYVRLTVGTEYLYSPSDPTAILTIHCSTEYGLVYSYIVTVSVCNRRLRIRST